MMFLAYLFTWDPSRELFTLPWINHPVGWYGACFAFGFIVAYFVFIRMLTSELLVRPTLTEAHIHDWPRLLSRLGQAVEDSSDPLHRLCLQFSEAGREELLHGENLEENSDLKEEVLLNLRDALKGGALPDEANVLLHPSDWRLFKKLQESSAARARLLMQRLFDGALATTREVAMALADHLCWFAVVGTVVGARLGHVVFYGWDYYSANLSEIVMVWHGGLASHGGALGVMLALGLFVRLGRRRMPQLNWLYTLDLVAVPTAITSFCIRMGNFFNQEIIGTPTEMPWGIVFGHPAQGGPIVPRHAVQLYEGFFSLVVFAVLYTLWRRGIHRGRQGLLVGLFFVFIFSWRFVMEYFKVHQGGFVDAAWMQTGQFLSIPFVLGGAWLVVRAYCSGQTRRSSCRAKLFG